MTFREALEVFLNLDKNKQGVGGRNADKKIKDKGDLNKLKTKRSIKGTYKDYGVRFQKLPTGWNIVEKVPDADGCTLLALHP